MAESGGDKTTGNEEPEQLRLMKRMVELAEYQTELSRQRTAMSVERNRMSADRSRMSEDRSRMSADRSRMSEDRSRMSAERSEMSENRSYQNAERTLSVWTRTALALMVFGIVLDRFMLLVRRQMMPEHLSAYPLSHFAGAALVAFGIVMALASGLRFLAYAMDWRRKHMPMRFHGPYLASSFAVLTVLFGIGVLVLLLTFS